MIFIANLFCIHLQLIKFIQVVLFISSAFFISLIIYRFIALQVFSSCKRFPKQGDVTTALIMSFSVMDYKRFGRNWYKQSYNSLCCFSLLIWWQLFLQNRQAFMSLYSFIMCLTMSIFLDKFSILGNSLWSRIKG